MKLPPLSADYSHFRWSRIHEEQYRHLWLLLFWPVYLIRYGILTFLTPGRDCAAVWCALDDRIPFLEAFVIPYILWYGFIVGMHIWLMLFDVPTFKRYSKFLLIAMGTSTLTYLIYPTCQNLRPGSFPRENALSWIVGIIYAVDSNANVCPSEHVIGALAVLAAAWNTKTLRPWAKGTVTLLAVLISASTVFIKQHSAVDVLMALILCALVYPICYMTGREKRPRKRYGENKEETT